MFRVGEWLVDPATRRISGGSQVMRLSPKAMGVLTALHHSEGSVVTRSALLDAVWPEVTVGEEVLTHAIAEIRKAFGDSRRHPRYIETVQKSGYRLLVHHPAASAASVDLPQSGRSAAQARDSDRPAAGEASRHPSIAVLPFSIIGEDPDQDYLAKGLTEDLTTDLSRISSLSVIAHASMLSSREQAPDPLSEARRFGVGFVLEGSIRKAGERVRISAQLIDAGSGHHVWGDRYDRVVEDIFKLQDDLTKEIVTALRVQLTDGENALVWNRGTDSIVAWKHAIGAVEAVLEYSATGNLQARELAQLAVDIDPGYALAWGVLGITYWYDARLGGGENRPADLMQEAERCATKAEAIDDANPWVIGLRVYLQVSQGDYEVAIETAQRGISKNPSSADLRGYLGYGLMNAGRSQDAVRTFDEAMRLNPLYPIWYRALMARALDACGQPERAVEVARSALELRPENFPSQLNLASLLGRAGQSEEAARYVAGVLRRAPNFNLRQAQLWLSTRDRPFEAGYLDGLRKAGLPE